jgi:enoyl-CoA hydratase
MSECEGTTPISVVRNGPVMTVLMDRPEARNAVDHPTAEALANAFRAFDAIPRR